MPVKYGRGKFKAHKTYIDYMSEIVSHKNYDGMPNAIDSKTGRINWQVSSGKTTSFYRYYLARSEWWSEKANNLGLQGTGNSNSRFSIAARLIHPTGMRPCRLCGNLLFVGYMYLNYLLTKRWNKISSSTNIFKKNDNVIDASVELINVIGEKEFRNEIKKVFPERVVQLPTILDGANLKTFFIDTSYLKTNYLSPGFMANPPDRLDGFHDYGICCRKRKDPGRSDKNMRTYNHDRRAFKWWAEGDWIVADELYNKAGPGRCVRCNKITDKISPDHIGPLSCGFKHIPLFAPLCNRCNSSKNRRFNLADVEQLMKYEKRERTSTASWQVRSLWDSTKEIISTEAQAKRLGNLMRSLQDYYLRVLHMLYVKGMSLPLSYLLRPENALFSVSFKELNPATLEYTSYTKQAVETKGRSGLATRVIRIAFEELEAYSAKKVSERKLAKIYDEDWREDLDEILDSISIYKGDPQVKEWDEIIRISKFEAEKKEKLIAGLLSTGYNEKEIYYSNLSNLLKIHFNEVGIKIAKLITDS